MPIKQYKPTTPGRRLASVADSSNLTKKRPEKRLSSPKKKTGGRNCQGKITCRHRGGGHKRRYRVIDFRRNKDGVPARVAAIEYDPNRSARLALLFYADGEKRYILCPDGVEVGSTLVSGEGVDPTPGNAMALKHIPLGMQVHCVEMQPGRGGQIVRSAGMSATLMAVEGRWALLSLPSGETRRVHAECRATIGVVGNADHMNVRLGKAGRKRWLGRRPHVRGTAMNPVAHPMGGGEGRSAGGRHPCSPTGKLAKGGKTRRKRSPSNKHIIRRRNAGGRR